MAVLELGHRVRDDGRRKRGLAMPTFMILGKDTEHGARAIKDSPKREETSRKACEKANARVKDVLYSLAAVGNVRTETLRAFTTQETEAALAKVA